jgi:phosphoribosylcarboxyaminoimidazole (NCAIR) mutase
LAVRTLAASDAALLAKMEAFNATQEEEVLAKATRLEEIGWKAYLGPK